MEHVTLCVYACIVSGVKEVTWLPPFACPNGDKVQRLIDKEIAVKWKSSQRAELITLNKGNISIFLKIN